MKRGQLASVGRKTERSRSADELSETVFPPLVGGGKTAPASYFKKLLGQVTEQLDRLACSTVAGEELVDEISFVQLYKKLFKYLESQNEDLFSMLTTEEHKHIMNATKRMSTFQNAANELKELKPEEIKDLRKYQAKVLKDKELLGIEMEDFII